MADRGIDAALITDPKSVWWLAAGKATSSYLGVLAAIRSATGFLEAFKE